MTPEFESQDYFYVAGRGRCFVVQAGEYGNRVDELLGHQVLIDDLVFTVIGVERFSIALPYPAHYSMGLLVKDSNLLPDPPRTATGVIEAAAHAIEQAAR